MPALSAKLSEALVKTTQTKDIEDAFNKVFTEYLKLKLEQLQHKIRKYEDKFDCSFEDFIKKAKKKSFKKEIYSFEMEKDYWEWEEAVTLRKHYLNIKNSWM